MRLSCRNDDVGRMLWELLVQAGRPINIYLDGIKQDLVCVADDEAGYIERAVVDANGSMQADKHDRIVTEKLSGKVVITLDPQG